MVEPANPPLALIAGPTASGKSALALALAERTLAAIGEDLLYARIDMARDPDGQWLLMEAELIEPDFYLGSAPDGGRNFAGAVKARL